MTDIRGDVAHFDYFNESLICERAYLDYWRAPERAKRERKAFRKYCAARRAIKCAFETEQQLLTTPLEDLTTAELLLILHETGRNMLHTTVETPFYMARYSETSADIIWIQLLPPESGANLEIAYLDLDVAVMEVSSGVRVPSPISVFGIGPDVTSDAPNFSIYAIPVAQNNFRSRCRNLN